MATAFAGYEHAKGAYKCIQPSATTGASGVSNRGGSDRRMRTRRWRVRMNASNDAWWRFWHVLHMATAFAGYGHAKGAYKCIQPSATTGASGVSNRGGSDRRMRTRRWRVRMNASNDAWWRFWRVPTFIGISCDRCVSLSPFSILDSVCGAPLEPSIIPA